jgi:hypothetical protein
MTFGPQRNPYAPCGQATHLSRSSACPSSSDARLCPSRALAPHARNRRMTSGRASLRFSNVRIARVRTRLALMRSLLAFMPPLLAFRVPRLALVRPWLAFTRARPGVMSRTLGSRASRTVRKPSRLSLSGELLFAVRVSTRSNRRSPARRRVCSCGTGVVPARTRKRTDNTHARNHRRSGAGSNRGPHRRVANHRKEVSSCVTWVSQSSSSS